MAENKESQVKDSAAQPKKQEVQTASVGSKLEVVGPYDSTSGAQVFRFYRDNEKKPTLDLIRGQVLTVGGNAGDLTKAEADSLLNNEQWEFKSK